jgi:hypothetical protein
MKKEMDRSVKSLKASDKGSYYRQEECLIHVSSFYAIV